MKNLSNVLPNVRKNTINNSIATLRYYCDFTFYTLEINLNSTKTILSDNLQGVIFDKVFWSIVKNK